MTYRFSNKNNHPASDQDGLTSGGFLPPIDDDVLCPSQSVNSDDAEDYETEGECW